MIVNRVFQSWWEQYRETVRCSNLRKELWLLLYGEGKEQELADRLIDLEKSEHPGELESWYLDKAIYNFRRRFSSYQ